MSAETYLPPEQCRLVSQLEAISPGQLIAGSPPRTEALELGAFAPASMALLESRALQQRTDTKFVLSGALVQQVLNEITSDYAILEANGERLPHYRTLYFDTDDLRCFQDHRRGRNLRHKIRIRHYPERQVSFLEVKRGHNGGTDKFRTRREFGDNELSAADRDFVQCHSGLAGDRLQAQLWTNFRRITLLSAATEERVTVDLALQFENDACQWELGCALVEVKQSRFSARSPVLRALRKFSVRPLSISKYCAATVLVDQNVRGNRFLPALRRAFALGNVRRNLSEQGVLHEGGLLGDELLARAS